MRINYTFLRFNVLNFQIDYIGLNFNVNQCPFTNLLFNMNRLILSICLLFVAGGLFAQAAPQAVYVLYSSQNMDILDYRMAYGGNSTTAYYAYNFKPGTNDQYTLYTGNGIFADYLPSGTLMSRDFKLSDELMTGVNNVNRQLFVVQQQQRGYVVSPVVSVTKITKSGNYYLVNAAAYSFILDTDNVFMGRELATAGSRSSVSLSTFGFQNCKYQYSFRRTPSVSGSESAEFDFIPGIGITSEKSGRTAAELQANQVTLWGINGLPLSDYINKECGNNGVQNVTPPPVPTNTTKTEPRLGDPGTGDPQPVADNNLVSISLISNHPTVNCNKTAAAGYHIVQPKETLNGIARYYGVTVAQLKAWNGIKDANKITVCQELRVAAGTTSAKSPVQLVKGGNVSPTGTPNVVLPPAQPATQPTYQPTQPSPQSSLPKLFDPGTPPATYSSPQPTVAVPNNNNTSTGIPAATASAIPAGTALTPVTSSTTATPTVQGQYYSVMPGEGVYTIAKKFGYTDERFRAMNNFPPTGNIALQVGQLVKVSDCEHAPVQTFSTLQVTPTTSKTATTPTVPPGTVVSTGTQPAPGGLTQPAAPGYQPLQPVTSSTNTGLTQPGTNPGFVPIGTAPANQPAITQPDTKPATKKEPIGFKDYFVRDSETIKDIARKQQLDPAELALINGKDQNEVLPPGTRIQLPIY